MRSPSLIRPGGVRVFAAGSIHHISWPHRRRLQLVDLVYHSVRKLKDCFAIHSNNETFLIFQDIVVIFFIVLSAESAAQVVDWSSDSLIFFLHYFGLFAMLNHCCSVWLCLLLYEYARIGAATKGYTLSPFFFLFSFSSPIHSALFLTRNTGLAADGGRVFIYRMVGSPPLLLYS